MLGKIEKRLLEDLKMALNPGIHDEKKPQNPASSIVGAGESNTEIKWDELTAVANKHAVLPFLYDVYEEKEGMPKDFLLSLKQAASITVRSNYRLLFLTKYITNFLEENGIRAIVLKGVATASYYPVPELRKAGDVDILIPEEEAFLKACRLLKQEGFTECDVQSALHHMELKNDEGISVEVHKTLAEPFESRKINRYLEKLLPEYREHVVFNTSWDIGFYQPGDAYHAFYLVIHMLQHFLRAGFGIKFLCDWAVFWNREISQGEKEIFWHLMKESGTEGFVAVLTAACVEYLGLSKENVNFLLEESSFGEMEELFMEEVFAAGEFGHGAKQRMVAMRGAGFLAYVREFHHQMRLNYPKAGKFFLVWPVLWICTFFRFLYNNRKVRGVRGRDILREAGKRSRLIDGMKLFS